MDDRRKAREVNEELTEPPVKDDLRGPSEEEQATTVGGGVGGVVGMGAGAAAGLVLGPVGAVIGALAGGTGGWWAGSKVMEELGEFDEEDDAYYRRIHDQSAQGAPAYDEVRHAYHLGHVAACNPEYREREFSGVEADLRRAWEEVHGDEGKWEMVRPYVDRGFVQCRERQRDARP